MHAASVNPEPGSNSLKNCIISYPREVIIFLESFLTIFYYFVEFFSKSAFLISQENINEILSHLHVLKNFLCCSIFKEQVPRPRCSLEVGLSIIAKVFSFVNPFFKKSLFFLKNSFFRARTRWNLSVSFIILYTDKNAPSAKLCRFFSPCNLFFVKKRVYAQGTKQKKNNPKK